MASEKLNNNYQGNVVTFTLANEGRHIIDAKEILNLKQCGKTRLCLDAGDNIYNCECYDNCQMSKKLLKLFL